MAVVELSMDEARQALAGREQSLSIAVSNSPRSTVIAGDTAALDALLGELEAREVFCRRIKVNVASHSPQMDPLRADLLSALEGLTPRAAVRPFHSTVMGTRLDGTELDAAYWVRNLREPVLFSTVVQGLIADGFDAFIEMSSHPLLVGAVQEMLRDADAQGIAIGSSRRDADEPSALRSSVLSLYVAGGAVDWNRLWPSGRVVATPSYPWQRERYWFEAPPPAARPRAGDLLGEPFAAALRRDTLFWEFELSTGTVPSLADHRVRGAVVVPAAMMIELAREAGRRAFGRDVQAVEHTTIASALVVPEGASLTVQIQVAIESPGVGAFSLSSREGGASPTVASWVRHATATVREDGGAPPAATPDVLNPQGTRLDAQAFYGHMRARTLGYGATYQGVAEAWRDGATIVARIRPADPAAGATGELQWRSALLDACFQAVLAAAPGELLDGQADTYVPTAVDSLRTSVRPAPDVDLFCHATTRHEAGTLAGDLTLVDADGRVLLEARGVRMVCLERAEDRLLRAAFHRLDWISAPSAADGVAEGGTWMLVGPASTARQVVAEHLRARGARAVELADAERLGAALIADGPVRGVVCMAALDAAAAAVDGIAATLRAAQVLAAIEGAPRLWLVTQGAQAVVAGDTAASHAGAGVWGLRATIAAEHPRLRCAAIDAASVADEAASLANELLADGPEDQVAIRGGARFVRRLRAGLAERVEPVAESPAAGRPFRVTTSTPGILDALAAETMIRRAPRSHEVEIEVVVAGLNFMNVMSAMGTYPGYPQGLGPLGIECAGRVVAVGPDVTDMAIGDRVAAFAHGSLATHVTADARLVTAIAPAVSFDQAATLPVAFLTAYYALHHLGRLSRGERVLIHSATGGVGLAAVQLARAAGAEIFATAGTEEKRAYLRSIGIAHVADSRSRSFADEFRMATGGEGIDLVFNSLTGDAIEAGMGLLRGGGRFIEIGKRDIYENRSMELWPFHRNLSYFAVDLDLMAREQPATLGRILRECMAHVRDAGLQPLPYEAFDTLRVPDAFRRMAQGAHVGKIVIRIDRDATPIRGRVSAAPSDWTSGTYLVTGGTGGLGAAVAEWMVAQGARDLVLVSRRGETVESRPRIESLRRTGARVFVAAADVSREADVRTVLADIAARGQRLAGIVHAAGVLDDATLTEVTGAKLSNVFAAKVLGAWHLHGLTADQPLDFFVLFSSVASFIGLSGQANYAAANACLDSLAAERRARGLPAISVNWGPWSEVGLAAAAANRGDRLSERGLHSLAPAVGVAAFGELLTRNPVQAAVMPFDFASWAAAYPAARTAPLFAEFTTAPASGAKAEAAPSTALRDDLLALPAGRARRTHLEAFVRQQVAHVLKLTASRVDVAKPFRTMGLDSLMGLELRNRLEAAAKVTVPATVIWNYPTVRLLVPQLAARMNVSLDESEAQEAPAAAGDQAEAGAEVEALLAEIENLSEEDARRLLAEGL